MYCTRPHLSLILLSVCFQYRTSEAFSIASSPSAASQLKKDTKVAVNGDSTVHVVPPPLAPLYDVTLTTYMRLPVEQYVLIPMPLGSSLTKVENTQQLMDEDELQSTSTSPYGEEFELVVPTITFFNLSLQPIVYASVQPHANQVVISSDKCILRGSSFIERTKLNERFDFRVKTTLTWNDALSNVGYNGVESVQIDESIQQNQLSEACETTDADCSTINNSCSITASTSIDVDVNVPKPFSSIPKAILQRTGNAAMKLSMKYIQGNFVENLAKDYERWATDAEYRSYRSSLSSDKEGRSVDDVVGEDA